MKINGSTYYFALIFSLFFNNFYAQQESKPTNIIFYLSDDQDLFDYGVYGNPKVETSNADLLACLLYTSPSPRDKRQSRMPSSA